MNSLFKKIVWSDFKPIKYLNRITLRNYAAMIIIVIFVTIFWKGKEGLINQNTDKMNVMEDFLSTIIERNRISPYTTTQANALYSTWKSKTVSAIQEYVSEFMKYHGNVRVFYGVTDNRFTTREIPTPTDMNNSRKEVTDTFTSTLPIDYNRPHPSWAVDLPTTSVGYTTFITETTHPASINLASASFRIPQTTNSERLDFDNKLKDIEFEIVRLLTNWFTLNPTTNFNPQSMFTSYSPSITSIGSIDSGQTTSTTTESQQSISQINADTSLAAAYWKKKYEDQLTKTGLSTVASSNSSLPVNNTIIAVEYWKKKYEDQISGARVGSILPYNSSLPVNNTITAAEYWKKKYEEQISGPRVGSILPYNSSSSYSLLNNDNTSNPTASRPTASNPTASNPTASNTTASNTTASKTESTSSTNDSCSAATDDMYMLKSKMVYMNPTSSNADSKPTNNYADSRDTKQAPYPPCPACDRCPEPAFDCKKVPNYKSVAINQYLPQPVLSSFAQFGM